MTELEIKSLIDYPNEERYLEFKGPVHWTGDIKAKITKSIMAMANLKDGGWIVIGKEEQSDRTFQTVGVSQEEFDSFDPDDIKAFVYSYAEPPINFDIIKKVINDKKFVMIKVAEFNELPIICKRSYGDIIHCGKIYVRSKGKPESIPVPSDAEMREIIEIAVDKGISSFVGRLQRTGVWAPKEQLEKVDDEGKFMRQLEGLL